MQRNKDCNLRNYSIFHKVLPSGEHLLFSYVEYTGDDFAADMGRMVAPDAINNDLRRLMTRTFTSFKTGL